MLVDRAHTFGCPQWRDLGVFVCTSKARRKKGSNFQSVNHRLFIMIIDHRQLDHRHQDHDDDDDDDYHLVVQQLLHTL